MNKESNDRIKDFALEAIVKNIAVDAWVFTDKELEKFVEMIVKDCAYKVNNYQRKNSYTDYAKMLYREFGIEYKDEYLFGKD